MDIFRGAAQARPVLLLAVLCCALAACTSDTKQVEAWVSEVEGYGYQFGPTRKRATARSLEWPLRLGLCVALTIGYHIACGAQLKKLRQGVVPHTHVWYRWFNELPVVLLLGAVVLVVVKPF